ncbi:ABC transporter ATP-binding protein [Mucilaginibacter phyllosphaerae]|uniref:ABC transporter ATP-binding protein n=1 Tax=Mucilaginibacter phyllosphaerae TaxID=1812349 RepID=A0A4Y8AI71_9SPHI|nr:ABC transporter ATP-binding protein [Mucilaginibacter phyllosphaerae]MBB3968540.1 lipopolysaccharide transport system ATP-binding protein [Mucilaginibacter phyllosphaerae]TEW67819.1 ABC transporter ATP-binding protein [Mucilaginibacter phyllosphaerae]GGH15376.1 ABC transporter ATP-binding protein [Mucilaginibacter phyllosphaerae]
MAKAIKAEGISKAYQLGDFGTGTVSRDLERYWARLRGKEDPFLKIGETNDRTLKGESDIVWSLKDINFEIEQGDAVGIIGRNGAGKSTLLKILSRVTAPTTGSVKVKGRIASLLEVGTGFHPELSGRENIYLNGAILGMRKAEIKRKFDEIVTFAGVERYIDTPVKRYSSGMYVRLAFAVAAHLESEILVIDEVLAVGDAEFQKKCLGKMNDVSKGEGRTVLFVSHNLGSIRQLCSSAMLLSNGNLLTSGPVEDTLSQYLKSSITNGSLDNYKYQGTMVNNVKFVEFSINNVIDKEAVFSPSETLTIRVKYNCITYLPKFRVSINFYKDSILISTIHDKSWPAELKEGEYSATFSIVGNFLRPGNYTIGLGGHDGDPISEGKDWLYLDEVYSFTITNEWSELNDFSGRGLVNIPKII